MPLRKGKQKAYFEDIKLKLIINPDQEPGLNGLYGADLVRDKGKAAYFFKYCFYLDLI